VTDNDNTDSDIGTGRDAGPGRSGSAPSVPGNQKSGERLRGKELAAHLEQRRKDRVQRQPRGLMSAGGAGPMATPRRRPDEEETSYGADLFGRRERDRRQTTVLRGTLIAGGLVVVLIVVSALRVHDSISLKTSCDTPGFAVSGDTVSHNGVLEYKLTGPTGQYAISARPSSGAGTDTVLTPIRGLKNCRAKGAFKVTLPASTYTLTIVRTDSPLTSPSPTKTLTVTP
jgi:hypothetical protein